MITTADFEKLENKDPRIKFGFAKELIQTANIRPKELYPYYDVIVEYLNHYNSIIRWTAIDLIGYLSKVDDKNKTKMQISVLLTFLHCGHLITANHAIFSLGKIAEAKPEYRDLIVEELLKISHDTFDTEECKNIAIGKVLDALKPFAGLLKNDQSVISFIKNAKDNSRNATKNRALLLLKRLKNL